MRANYVADGYVPRSVQTPRGSINPKCLFVGEQVPRATVPSMAADMLVTHHTKVPRMCNPPHHLVKCQPPAFIMMGVGTLSNGAKKEKEKASIIPSYELWLLT